MKKLLLSPLLIIVLIVVLGVGIAGAAIFLGGAGSSTGEVNLQKGLVGWWKFNGNAKDSTPYGNNGTVTGATLTTDRKGQANKAYSFNGSSYIDAGNGTNLTITSAFSVEAWVKKSDLLQETIISKSNGSSDTNYVLDLRNSNNVAFFVYDTSGGAHGVIPSTNAVSVDTWTHLVGTYDGTIFKVYINGVQDPTTTTWSGSIKTNNISTVFGGRGTPPSIGSYWNGPIDDVRIYKRALSATEVTALYQEYDPGIVVSDLQKGLVGQWKFNGNAKDSTPYGNNGTVYGATLTTDRKGQVNKAYSFNGTSNHVDTVNSANLNISNEITISAWVNPSTLNKINGIVDKVSYSTWHYGYYLEIISTNKIQFVASNNNSNRSVNSLSNVSAGWVHIVGVADSTSLKIYINGILDNTKIASGDIGLNTNPLRIGSNYLDSARYFSGAIDDVRVYNRALSATEVMALYEEYDSGIQAASLGKGLIGQWQMDGNAKDSTPYGNNGVVTGAILTTDRKGQANKAYSFNGTSDHILVGNVGSSIKTISFWMQANVTASKKIINIDGTKQIELNGSSNIVATSFPAATVYIDGSPGSAINDTNWHLVMITDTTGVSVSTFDIGAVSTSYFNGKIDDVRVYNGVLSTTQIASLAGVAECTCPTAGICQTGGGCSSGGGCIAVSNSLAGTQAAGCTGTCVKCDGSGNCVNQSSSEDLFNQCPAIDCHTGATKYYYGWSSNTCYYEADISDANAVCNGAGVCKTAAVQCAASSQGVSTGVTRSLCQTQAGCTGTTAGSIGNVAPGNDTYNDCAAYYNNCSGNNAVGPDGNCNGSGICNTSGLSTSCPTYSGGTCQTTGGCSGAGVCVSQYIGSGNKGTNCNSTCYYCNGSGSCIPVPNGQQDGPNCTDSHYRCNGGGSCTAPTQTSCIQDNASYPTCSSLCTAQGTGVCYGEYDYGSGCTVSIGACSLVYPNKTCSCQTYVYP